MLKYFLLRKIKSFFRRLFRLSLLAPRPGGMAQTRAPSGAWENKKYEVRGQKAKGAGAWKTKSMK
jgi:hypothetical protein